MTGVYHIERTFHGKTQSEMNCTLKYVYLLKEKFQIPENEKVNFDIAIRCISEIIKRMKTNKTIEWD